MPESPPRPAGSPSAPSGGVSRRQFLSRAGTGATLLGLAGTAPVAANLTAPAAHPPVLMHAGHQHDHSAATLRLLAAFGVKHICSGLPSPRMDGNWSVAGLTALRQHVESFGIALDCIPLPLSSREITRAEYPEILLAQDPERERALDDLCAMIRHAGAAGIPMVKYNLTFLGVVRTAPVTGRGGARMSAFEHAQLPPGPPTPAGHVTEEIYWDRIAHFLRRVVPVAEEAKVKIALHPQDPGLPAGAGYRGVHAVLSSVEGLKRFVATQPSDYHGLNFCQGTVAEMLVRPHAEIPEVIRWFGRRGKIFNVHFRNIRGGFLKFHETLPDDGDVDMLQALRTYREVGYEGMIMPDHVPSIEGDPDHYKAFAFCFGYTQALLQVLRVER
jgi:mannonate dehydratase